MKTINAIAFRNLRNDEFYGIHSEAVDFAKAITDKTVLPLITSYEASVKELSNFLETNLSETAARQASELDAERNKYYASCRNTARSLQNFPDETAAANGAKIWKAFEENASPIGLNQAQSTGIILNIIQTLRNLGDDILESCGFKVWLDKLEEINNQFQEADRKRFTEKALHELEQGKRLRQACVEAFNLLAAMATVKSSLGDEACSNFIDNMNAAISAKKIQLKLRKERSKQGTDTSQETTQKTEPIKVAEKNVA
ncbi:DUF6261 family protein [Fibrobacter sp. UWEL]|uniref:DUF6261 family protein n=1 Tax=Fibrobacter sp. UWEL TaxID=1896209 RepID=UPI0009162E3B|nr:DUF6261 family protein [Fibrobacter sp. UWEL]SHK64611.1 hypothetical protein SAMN05720468_104159 [Fibrobacter sp. UWEL]